MPHSHPQPLHHRPACPPKLAVARKRPQRVLEGGRAIALEEGVAQPRGAIAQQRQRQQQARCPHEPCRCCRRQHRARASYVQAPAGAVGVLACAVGGGSQELGRQGRPRMPADVGQGTAGGAHPGRKGRTAAGCESGCCLAGEGCARSVGSPPWQWVLPPEPAAAAIEPEISGAQWAAE